MLTFFSFFSGMEPLVACLASAAGFGGLSFCSGSASFGDGFGQTGLVLLSTIQTGTGAGLPFMATLA